MEKPVKLFTAKITNFNRTIIMVNRPAPEIFTSLVLDHGVNLMTTFGRKVLRLDVDESAELLTQTTAVVITRTK